MLPLLSPAPGQEGAGTVTGFAQAATGGGVPVARPVTS